MSYISRSFQHFKIYMHYKLTVTTDKVKGNT